MAGKNAPKTGGRAKGTPNKGVRTLMDKCDELGCDPFEVLLKVAKGDWKSLGYESQQEISGYSQSGDPYFTDVIQLRDRVTAAKEACQYLHPKRKAVEIGLSDPKVVNEIEKLSQLDSDELKAVIKEELKANA